jgi:hypothetical protein
MTRTKTATKKASAFTAPKAVTAVAAKAPKQTRRETNAEAQDDPDALIEQLAAQHNASRAAYNRDGGYKEPEDDPLWAAYEKTRDALYDAKPVGIRGILAKARAAKFEAEGLDGKDAPDNTPAADWAWHIVNDLLRLGTGLNLEGSDAELIADHERLDALERQWFALFDKGLSNDEFNQASDPIQAAKKPIFERLAKRRATTAAGLAARLRSLITMEPENDYDGCARSPGADADERLESMILRDLSEILGVPTKGAFARRQTETSEECPKPSSTIPLLMQEIGSALAGQAMALKMGKSAFNDDQKRHASRLYDLMTSREFDAMDMATNYRADGLNEAALALINAGRIAEDFRASDFTPIETSIRQERQRRCLYSAVHVLIGLVTDQFVLDLRDKYMPLRIDPLEPNLEAAQADEERIDARQGTI